MRICMSSRVSILLPLGSSNSEISIKQPVSLTSSKLENQDCFPLARSGRVERLPHSLSLVTMATAEE